MARSISLLLVFAFVGLSSVANASEITPFEFARAIIKLCVLDSKVDQEIMAAYVSKGTFPSDKECIFKCFLQAAKGMDMAGNFERDNLARFVPEERRHTIDQCLGESKADADACHKAFHFHNCFRLNQLDWYQDAMKRIMADGFLS